MFPVKGEIETRESCLVSGKVISVEFNKQILFPKVFEGQLSA
jgi:hypothetical protein